MNRRALVLLLIIVLILVGVSGGAAAYFLLNSSSGGGSRTITLPDHNRGHKKKTPTPTPTPTQATHLGKGCGVKRNNDGTFSFSWLHVSSDGMVVDESGCIVTLVGFSMGGLSIFDAGAGVGGGATQKTVDFFKQNFATNVARVSFNTVWWNQDVLVPKANMHYRQWLQLFVKTMEQSGNFVELDPTTNFPEPPCGGPITLCPPQDQGEKDYAAHPNANTAQESPFYVPPILQAWNDLAQLYANDPAVIYDAWNEPRKEYAGFFQDMNTLINTIRSHNPRSLVVVFAHDWPVITSGKVQDYAQPNVVIDFHIYDGFSGTSPINGQPCQEPGTITFNPFQGFNKSVDFARSHNQGVIINEWGGCYDLPQYNQNMLAFAKQLHVGLVYFNAGNIFAVNHGNFVLNDNGRLVQPGYASILGG